MRGGGGGGGGCWVGGFKAMEETCVGADSFDEKDETLFFSESA